MTRPRVTRTWQLAKLSIVLGLCLLQLACGGTSNNLREQYLADTASFLEPPTHPVVIMTGFGQMKLYDPVTQRIVWGTPHTMVQTRWADDLDLPVDPDTAEVGRDRLVARGFVGLRSSFNYAWHLGRVLERYAGYEAADDTIPPDQQEPRLLYRFAYDFRLSSAENAKHLDAYIDGIRRAHRSPSLEVDLLTHSLGGIVALTYLSLGTAPIDDPSAWDAGAALAASKVRNAIMLAPPQKGTIDAFRVMVQNERFALRVLFPEWSALYPSITELLPADGRIFIREDGTPIEADVWNIETWRRLELSLFDPDIRERMIERTSEEEYRLHVAAFEKLLERARMVRRAIDRPLPGGVHVKLIASDCIPTSHRVLRRTDGSLAFYQDELRPAERHLADLMFVPGDGSITLGSAFADSRGGKTSIFCDGHQGMALDASVHRAIIRTLQSERAL